MTQLRRPRRVRGLVVATVGVGVAMSAGSGVSAAAPIGCGPGADHCVSADPPSVQVPDPSIGTPPIEDPTIGTPPIEIPTVTPPIAPPTDLTQFDKFRQQADKIRQQVEATRAASRPPAPPADPGVQQRKTALAEAQAKLGNAEKKPPGIRVADGVVLPVPVARPKPFPLMIAQTQATFIPQVKNVLSKIFGR